MNVPGLYALQRAARRLKKGSSAKAIILMYHRVVELNSDPWGLAVSPHHFAEHLEVITRYARPIHLEQLVREQQQGNLRQNGIVVTFDDGYTDNLYYARPLLQQYDVPATVFITTGKIGQAREFWWDELDRLLLQPGTLPRILQLQVNGATRRWDLGHAAVYREKEFHCQRQRRAWEGNPGSRLALYYDIYRLLQPMLEEKRQEVLVQLVGWAGAEAVERTTHRTITVEELHRLAEGDLIKIGAHTVTHPFLSAHRLQHQRGEIQESKRFLEDLLDRPVNTFSYPHGDYSKKTLALVREAGFDCACTTFEDNVWHRSDPFQLPRIEMQDWDGETFAECLHQWLKN